MIASSLHLLYQARSALKLSRRRWLIFYTAFSVFPLTTTCFPADISSWTHFRRQSVRNLTDKCYSRANLASPSRLLLLMLNMEKHALLTERLKFSSQLRRYSKPF